MLAVASKRTYALHRILRRYAMDWLICIGVGLAIGVIGMLASLFSQWADEAVKGGAYKRRDW